MRRRYFVVVSVAYIVLGLIIVSRSLLAQVPVAGILGVVLVALGIIRLRDFLAQERGP